MIGRAKRVPGIATMVAILGRPFFFFPRVCATRQKQQISSLGNKERLDMNRCATFAHRLIVPPVAAQQSRNCTFAKTGSNREVERGGVEDKRETGKSEREKKRNRRETLKSER